MYTFFKVKLRDFLQCLWPTRNCLILHKVKHHHTNHQPGQQSSQSDQQLCRHLQLPQDPLTQRPGGAPLCCSIGPTGCGGRSGSFIQTKKQNKIRQKQRKIVNTLNSPNKICRLEIVLSHFRMTYFNHVFWLVSFYSLYTFKTKLYINAHVGCKGT